MKHRTGLLAAPACAVAAAALLAAPALAASTFTVSPGGAWSGTRAADSTVGIRDAASNQVILTDAPRPARTYSRAGHPCFYCEHAPEAAR